MGDRTFPSKTYTRTDKFTQSYFFYCKNNKCLGDKHTVNAPVFNWIILAGHSMKEEIPK